MTRLLLLLSLLSVAGCSGSYDSGPIFCATCDTDADCNIDRICNAAGFCTFDEAECKVSCTVDDVCLVSNPAGIEDHFCHPIDECERVF